MKRLIMCEGPNELEVVRILLENDALIFGEDDLLGLTPYYARQIASNKQVLTELMIYPNNDVVVMRVGDTQRDVLKIPADVKDKIMRVEKYCTRPELEMLLIISENLTDEFEKSKSTVFPKQFAKSHIRCGRRKYNNDTAFYREYYGGDCNKLIAAIRRYKEIRKGHKKEELYLADMLK